MRKLKPILISALLLAAHLVSAQPVDMADSMQAQGKINVVVTIAFLVLAILAVWLIRIEYRVRRMEKEQNTRP